MQDFLNPRSPTDCEMEAMGTAFGCARDRFQPRISPFFHGGVIDMFCWRNSIQSGEVCIGMKGSVKNLRQILPTRPSLSKSSFFSLRVHISAVDNI